MVASGGIPAQIHLASMFSMYQDDGFGNPILIGIQSLYAGLTFIEDVTD